MSASTLTPKATALKADPWLGRMLGRAAYRLEVATNTATGAEELSRLDPGAFVYAKAPTAWTVASGYLQELGFRVVDTNVQLRKSLTAADSGAELGWRHQVELARPEDEAAIVELARTGFNTSRFHLDPCISRHCANAIKAEWAANFFAGKRGEAMVVARVGGEVAGFCQLLCPFSREVVIDLIAVAAAYRRQGVARAILRFLETGLPGVEEITVGTQVANIASLRLYEDCGFRMAQSQYVFHYHSQARMPV